MNFALHSLLLLILNRLSLLDLPRLLTNKPYREWLLANVKDQIGQDIEAVIAAGRPPA